MKKFLVLCLTFCTAIACGKSLTLDLTHVNTNFYSDSHHNIFVKTKYCNEYSHGERAYLNLKKNTLAFVKSKKTCEVDALYRLKPFLLLGDSQMMLSTKELGLYEVFETRELIFAPGCMALVLADESKILNNRIHFSTDKEICEIRFILEKINFN